MPSSRALFTLSNLRRLASGRIPGQVVIQFTDRCNALCAQCAMRATNRFERSTLDVDQVKRLLDAMAERGVRSVSFTGGEPLLFLDQVLECARHAAHVGITLIRTGTNGFLFRGVEQAGFHDRMNKLADSLADSPLNTFWISVDSADARVHEKNRGLPGVLEGVARALPLFHERGLYPSANLGINRLAGGGEGLPEPDRTDGRFDAEGFAEAFRNAFRRFYSSVEELGFTMVNACYPMSMDEEPAPGRGKAVYAATSRDDFIRFTAREKAALFRALYDVAPEFRSRLRIFTPRSSLLALARQYGQGGMDHYPCRGGTDFFFVDSRDMDTFPCGYRGAENLGKFWDLDLDALDAGDCSLCDWECFRDPSELAGPVMDLLRAPWRLSARLLGDREYARAWIDDLRYYRACDFFDARRPPDPGKLARFARP